MPQSKQSIKEAKLEQIADESEREHQKFIDKVQEDSHKVTTLEEKKDEEKREWIKTSFWAPDNTPLAKEQNNDEPKPPSKNMYCPAVSVSNKDAHKIKVKELITLKLDANDLEEFVCWTCQKPLVH